MGGDNDQFLVFKDCLARRIISQAVTGVSPEDTTSDLDDFTSYLALEAWPSLPSALHSASHETLTSLPELDTVPLYNTPTSFSDTLISYRLSPDIESALQLLRKTLEDYLREACAPPPVWAWTRTTECEICERGVPLTYHHLIPRSTHAKALKKKWHAEAILNSVAWLYHVIQLSIMWRLMKSSLVLITLWICCWKERIFRSGECMLQNNDMALDVDDT